MANNPLSISVNRYIVVCPLNKRGVSDKAMWISINHVERKESDLLMKKKCNI